MWRHIAVSSWRSRRLNTTSDFLLVDATVFGRWISISKPNCHRHTSIRGWYITTYVLEKQTSAILEFYCWFRFPLYHHRDRHAILHQADKFHPNETTYSGNMTSSWFAKMAAAAAQYYFHYRIFRSHCLQKVKVSSNQILSTYLD